MNNEIQLIYKSGDKVSIPKEAIINVNFSNMWMFKKRIKGTKDHVWTPIYDIVVLEFDKSKLDKNTIDKIMGKRDLLLIERYESNQLIENYIAWHQNSRFAKINNLQKNEENLFDVKISSCKLKNY